MNETGVDSPADALDGHAAIDAAVDKMKPICHGAIVLRCICISWCAASDDAAEFRAPAAIGDRWCGKLSRTPWRRSDKFASIRALSHERKKQLSA